MSLETGNRIADLVPTNPVGATDFVSNGDDHIRLLKVCIQGSLPNLGANPVLATAEELNTLDGITATTAELNTLDGITASVAELNFTDGVTSNIQTQLNAKLATSTAAATYQPLDSDLTALAGLNTQTYGRDFNVLANDAALATKIAALAPTWTGTHQFSKSGSTSLNGGAVISAAVPVLGFVETGAATDSKVWDFVANSGVFRGRLSNDAGTGNFSWVEVSRLANAVTATNFPNGVLQYGGLEVGFRSLSYDIKSASYQLVQADNGKSIITNNSGITITLPALTDGTIVTIIQADAAVTVTSSSGAINWFNGSSITTGNRTLATGAVATVLRVNSAWYIWGMGIS